MHIMATETVQAPAQRDFMSADDKKPDDNISLTHTLCVMHALLECADAKIEKLQSNVEGDTFDQLVSLTSVVNHCAEMTLQLAERVDIAWGCKHSEAAA
jgi:hypothetical protein